MIQISSIEELQAIGNNPDYPLNGEYELTQDIDASDTVHWNGGKGFIPIGSRDNPFRGKFDGKGHKIKRLYINHYNTDYIGLFCFIGSGSEVKNIGLTNTIIIGNYFVGGLIGANYGTVKGCYITGSVLGEWHIGGLVGKNRKKIEGCYSSGFVFGKKEAGGLVGWNCGTVNNSYAMDTVVGSHYVGGLIGSLYGGNVVNTYSTGLIGGSGDNIGGLIGYIETSNNPIIKSSYWDIETSKMATSPGGEGKTTAEMKQRDTFIGWDFVNIWCIKRTYPFLRSIKRNGIEKI